MTLEQRILDAHARGDARALGRLQAEFRRTRDVVRPAGAWPMPTVPIVKRSAWTGGTPSVLDTPRLEEGAAATFTVALTDVVRSAIESEIRDALFRFGTIVETGGHLYSLYRPRRGSVTIVHASGPGPYSKHWPGKVQMSDANDVEAEFSDVLERAALTRVGDWHSHPRRDPRPSEPDLRAWGSAWESQWKHLGMRRYLGLVVTPGEIGWDVPAIHAWVTTKDTGRLVCEPAHII